MSFPRWTLTVLLALMLGITSAIETGCSETAAPDSAETADNQAPISVPPNEAAVSSPGGVNAPSGADDISLKPVAPEPQHQVATVPAVSEQAEQQDSCEQEHPWQHTVNGKCVDKPGTIHHSGDYEPVAGEECWVECLCYEGQYPTGESCSPCSFVGMVCIPL
jgi:hypothetical protein